LPAISFADPAIRSLSMVSNSVRRNAWTLTGRGTACF
jgi:hypothetical protein